MPPMEPEAFQQYLSALSAEYRASLAEKLSHIDGLWAVLMGGSTATGPMTGLLRELRSLADSAKTFNVPEVSETARAAEFFIEPYCTVGALPAAAKLMEFESLLANLRRAAGAGPTAAPAARRIP